MSMSTNDYKNHQEKENRDDNEDEHDDNDENTKLVSIKKENNQDQQQLCEQQTSIPTLRSILHKGNERNTSINDFSYVQQTSIVIDERVSDNEEGDSDYTDDESEEGNNGSNGSIEEETKNNEQQQHRSYYYCHRRRHPNYSRHQQRNQFFRTLTSASPIFPSKSTAITHNENDLCSNRLTRVKFTNENPIIIRRSSSVSQLSGSVIQPCSSVTHINMEDISTTIPITTIDESATTLSAEYRPVYVSPLKYRPLIGVSADDSRLLLDKRISLLGKPVVYHPIQKRPASYRRTQLRIYNFLERPHGCKALLYHTFV